jgi:uncharacterized protein
VVPLWWCNLGHILLSILIDFWQVLGQMAPYLLFGFLMAGVLSVLIKPETVQRHFGGRGIGPVIKAAMFGVPLPLCSCGVIPVSASLRQHGASRGATTAFLISTPQTGVDSILVTYSLLGGLVAVFRAVTALISGVVGGALVMLFGPAEESKSPGSNGCQDACCAGKESHGRIYRALHYGFVTLPRDLSKSLLVGLVIAGAISALVPDDYFAGILGGGIGTMFIMMAVGIPMYVCATASVPIAAALIAKGVSPGAALVFLMTGPATNGATIATVWRVMGGRVAVIYLVSIGLTALASGLALDHLFAVSIASAHHHVHEMTPGVFEAFSAVVLIGVVGYAIIRPQAATAAAGTRSSEPGERVVLAISGMTCSHCVESVRRALSAVTGVGSVDVDLAGESAWVSGDHMDQGALRLAVEALGFGVNDVRIEGHH